MSATVSWERFLQEHFPGYLLPESQRTHIEAADAARFLERLTGRPQQLRILLGASILAAQRGIGGRGSSSNSSSLRGSRGLHAMAKASGRT